MTTESEVVEKEESFESLFDEKFNQSEPIEKEVETEAVVEDKAEEQVETNEEVKAEIENPQEETEEQQAIDYKALYDNLLHKTKSEEGRYSREVRERQKLEARIKELESQKSKPVYDEVDAAEIEKFRSSNPELAAKTIDDSEKGKAWAKLLLSRGADEVEALFEATHKEERIAQALLEEKRQEQARAHLNEIEKEHPDWQQLITNPQPQNENEFFHHEFVGWVGRLPIKVAHGVLDILKNGSASQINEVIAAYKGFRNAVNAPKPNSNRGNGTSNINSEAKQALAVKRTGNSEPETSSENNDEQSFDALWAKKWGKK